MFSILDLGEDIICSNIAVLLSPRDVFLLSLTCHKLRKFLTTNEVYHLLYIKKFGSKPTPLRIESYNWHDVFHLRSSPGANLFTWGSASMGRLGYSLSDIPSQNITTNGFQKNVHTPTNVSNFNTQFIDDISAGGFSIQILTDDGSLYFTGSNWKRSEISNLTPGPHECKDYSPMDSDTAGMSSYSTHSIPGVIGLPLFRRRLQNQVSLPQVSEPTRHQSGERHTNPNLRYPPEQQYPNSINVEAGLNSSPESNFVTRLKMPQDSAFPNRKIVSVSSGREHIIALDNYQNVLTWDSGSQSYVGINLRFSGIKYHHISKITAGWNLLACYINHIGIIYWCSRAPINKETYETGAMLSDAAYRIIPGTGSIDIDDIHAGCDFILFIKKGKLYRVDINVSSIAAGSVDEIGIDRAYPVRGFNNWLEDYDKEGSRIKFTKISGCYLNFAVFTNDGMVLLGNKDISMEDAVDNPIILPGLQKNNIIDVQMGDYHSLALTDNGSVLAWGVESNNCGCLGLGTKEEFTERYHLTNDEVVLSHPFPIKKPNEDGKWLAITSAGWHSCGIFVAP